eukprot:scaffold34938_cov53-Attheya_sp.AAC.4
MEKRVMVSTSGMKTRRVWDTMLVDRRPTRRRACSSLNMSQLFFYLVLLSTTSSFASAKDPMTIHKNRRKAECINVGLDENDSVFHCLKSPTTYSFPDCVDDEPRCAGWAKQGECSANPGYMNKDCKKSCNVCLDFHIGEVQLSEDVAMATAVIERLYRTNTYFQDEVLIRYPQLVGKCRNENISTVPQPAFPVTQ